MFVVLATASTAAGTHTARLLWNGTFANGVSSWTGVQASDGGLAIVPAPDRPGKAARFVVRPGVELFGGERAEVWKRTDEDAGTESFWAWSVYFPRGSTSSRDTWWNVFTQWHQNASTGVQPLSFEILNERGRESIRLHSWGGNADQPLRRAWRLAPLVRGKWYDFVLRVRWAPDRTGLVQVWLDQKQVLPETRGPTLYDGDGVYLKQGFYRQDSSDTSEVYIARTRRGASLGDLGISQTNSPAARTALRPKNMQPPVIEGVVRPGQVLKAWQGSWSPAPTRFRFQWQATGDGSKWRNLRGAIGRSLLLPATFSASKVRVQVTALNTVGAGTVASAPVGLGRVVKSPAPAPVGSVSIVQSIRAGQTLRGTVVWKVVPSSPVKQIDFAMDSNMVNHIDSSAPYEYVVDTTKLADGEHTFGLTVTRSDGTIVWRPYQIGTVTVDNHQG